jgi:hypothetical protein
MRALAILLGSIAVVIAPHASNAQWIDDPFNDYLQRSVTISMGAGNANDTNAAIQTINPWPPYVGKTHIHTTGRQGVDSIERMHRVPNPFERDGASGSGTTGLGGDGAGAGGTSPTGAPVTPMQPISSGY